MKLKQVIFKQVVRLANNGDTNFMFDRPEWKGRDLQMEEKDNYVHLSCVDLKCTDRKVVVVPMTNVVYMVPVNEEPKAKK